MRVRVSRRDVLAKFCPAKKGLEKVVVADGFSATSNLHQLFETMEINLERRPVLVERACYH